MCHCLNCQRRSGSAFAVTARWPADQVTIVGHGAAFVLAGDEGSRATFRFCPTCAATVYFTNDGMTGMIAVPVGAFADPTFPAPVVAVYTARRHAWVPSSEIEEIE